MTGLTWILLLVLLFPACKSPDTAQSQNATRVVVDGSYILEKDQPRPEDIVAFIATHFPFRADEDWSNEAIARIIDVIGRCLKVDRVLVTAIIAAESSFERARRNPKSNAAGLMQMVPIAIEDMAYQFGMRISTRMEARSETVSHYDQALGCILADVTPFGRVNTKFFRELWKGWPELVANGRVDKLTNKIAGIFLRNPTYAITWGTAFFKLHLAKAKGDLDQALEAYGDSDVRAYRTRVHRYAALLREIVRGNARGAAAKEPALRPAVKPVPRVSGTIFYALDAGSWSDESLDQGLARLRDLQADPGLPALPVLFLRIFQDLPGGPEFSFARWSLLIGFGAEESLLEEMRKGIFARPRVPTGDRLPVKMEFKATYSIQVASTRDRELAGSILEYLGTAHKAAASCVVTSQDGYQVFAGQAAKAAGLDSLQTSLEKDAILRAKILGSEETDSSEASEQGALFSLALRPVIGSPHIGCFTIDIWRQSGATVLPLDGR